jgi:MFS family permease
MSLATSEKIYTSQFWRVCLSGMLFAASFNMLLPELPAYLTTLGGADYKGLIISLFTLTAMISRPFSGKLADKLGRVPVMMAGAVVCVVCSTIYPILTSVSGFLLLRLIHGFSTGFTPTGQAAYIADIIPMHKRGEAMGYLGTASTLGMAGGPAIGGTLANLYSLDMMFYCSSAFALISVLICYGVKETLKEKQTFYLEMLKVRRVDIFEPLVLVPCLVMVLVAFSYGAVYTLLPDFAAFVGIQNKGLVFTYFTVASLFIRIVGGTASDRFGRVRVLRVSTITIVIAMIVIGLAKDQTQLIVGVMVYGVGYGATSPTLLAWAADLSDPQNKGRGVASLYIFMEFGIGMGAFLSAMVFANDTANFLITFSLCCVLALLAFVYLMSQPKRIRA